MDCGFTTGCFQYDALVQGVATLGAFLVALALYRITRRSEQDDARAESAERWRMFELQSRQQQEQLDRAVAAMDQDREQWHNERYTYHLKRAHKEVADRLMVARAVRVELVRLHDLARNRGPEWCSSAALDGMTLEHMRLPGDVAERIAAAHHSVQQAKIGSETWLSSKRTRLVADLSDALAHVDLLIEDLAMREERRANLVAINARLGAIEADPNM